MSRPDGRQFIDELHQRHLVAQISDADALAKLLSDEATSVYAGYDPTASSLHVGNLVPTILLKRFQLAGHRPYVLVGGATGMIGDPSGKSEERNLLDEATLATNVAGIRAQLSRLLDSAMDGVIELDDDLRIAGVNPSGATVFGAGSDDLRGRDFRSLLAPGSRDKLQRLESLQDQFARLRFALESLSFVYTVPSADGSDDRSYVVRRGRVRAEFATPRDAAGQRAIEARVSELIAPDRKPETTVPGHEVDEVLLVAGWFRKHGAELSRTTPFAPAVRSA